MQHFSCSHSAMATYIVIPDTCSVLVREKRYKNGSELIFAVITRTL